MYHLVLCLYCIEKTLNILSLHIFNITFSFLHVKEFGFVHLSAGELLRQARDSGSSDGKLIDDYIKNGKIVPVEITISLLQKVSICVFGLGAFLCN